MISVWPLIFLGQDKVVTITRCQYEQGDCALTIVNTYTVHIYQIVELIEFLIANLKVQKCQWLVGISYLRPVFIYWWIYKILSLQRVSHTNIKLFCCHTKFQLKQVVIFCLQVVSLLLNYGADITLCNNKGQSILDFASDSMRPLLLGMQVEYLLNQYTEFKMYRLVVQRYM